MQIRQTDIPLFASLLSRPGQGQWWETVCPRPASALLGFHPLTCHFLFYPPTPTESTGGNGISVSPEPAGEAVSR